MKVESIMTTGIVIIKMDDTLRAARSIFTRKKFHHLLVVEDDVLYGVLSDRDLLKSISPNLGTVSETEKDDATLNKKVHQIMTRKPVTLTADADVKEVTKVFNTHLVSCIPVVDEDKHPIGIVSWRDVLKVCFDGKVA